MLDPGYVYILINASLPNLVKVGRTNRDPSNWVAELSSATEVPTPFTLVYSEYFDDCTEAELATYARLERKGYRLSANEEFFVAPLPEVIDSLLEAKKSASMASEKTDSGREDKNHESQGFVRNASDMIKEAERYYKGANDCSQNYSKAFELYQEAAKLGSALASYRLGFMYKLGEGRPLDMTRALEFLQQSADQGNSLAYLGMADIYLELNHIENFHKCWKKVFDSKGFWEEKYYLRGKYAFDYLEKTWEHKIPISQIPISNMDVLHKLRDSILIHILEIFEEVRLNLKEESLGEDNAIGSYYRERIQLVMDALFTRGSSE